MSDQTLGLLLQIDADPSKAETALQQFGTTAGQGFQQATESVKPFDDALLSNRETVRLLSSELGLHLPRAVTSAISQILPDIAMMGTAFLGVFAVEEVVKFAGYVKKCADEFNGVTEAAKQLKSAEDENVDAMEKAGKASIAYARTQVTLLVAQAAGQRAQVDMLRHEAEAWGLITPLVGALVTAKQFYLGISKEQQKAEADLINIEKMRDTMVKLLGEDETKAHNAAMKAAQSHAEAEDEFNKQILRGRQRIFAEIEKDREADWEKQQATTAKMIADVLKGVDAEYKAEDKLHTQLVRREQDEAKVALAVHEKSLKVLADLTKLQAAEDLYAGHADKDRVMVVHAHEAATVAATKRLVAEAKVWSELTGDATIYANAVWQAQQIVVQAHQDATAAIQVEAASTGRALAGMLGLEKEFVIMEAIFKIPKDIALAAERFAVDDYWGGAQYLLAAAQWGVAAGQAVAGIVGSFGGGGAAASVAGPGTTASGGTTAAGAAAAQAQTLRVIRIEGLDRNKTYPGEVVEDLLDAIMDGLNDAVVNGGKVLIATNVTALGGLRS